MAHEKQSFEEHMLSRRTICSNVKALHLGNDFAVFEFETKEDKARAFKFALACNQLYSYEYEDTDLMFVCFENLLDEKEK
jgi:hypothetical protein